MLKSNLFATAALGTSLLLACAEDESKSGPDTTPPTAAAGFMSCTGNDCVVAGGEQSGDLTFAAGKTYTIKTHMFMVSGTLTIEPGVTIKGEPGSSIVITKGARVNAVGTAQAPIVMTATSGKAGGWGGLVMLGAAPTNVTGGSNAIEGFPAAGDKTRYGGSDPAHNCGSVKYVRIEYAGFELAKDNELNGLTLGGCGNATLVDYVQVHRGADDGVEVFGGTVNLSHIVVTLADDDGLDWDFGWTGKAQYLIVQQGKAIGDKGIEADNNKSVPDATPRSAPHIWNATIIGGGESKKQGGMHFKVGTAGTLNNVIVANFAGFAVDVDGKESAKAFLDGSLALKNTHFVAAPGRDLWPTKFDWKGKQGEEKENDCYTEAGAAVCFDEATLLTAGNHIMNDLMLVDAINVATPNFALKAGMALAACAVPPAGFDTTAAFCGAVGLLDWTAGWTSFPN